MSLEVGRLGYSMPSSFNCFQIGAFAGGASTSGDQSASGCSSALAARFASAFHPQRFRVPRHSSHQLSPRSGAPDGATLPRISALPSLKTSIRTQPCSISRRPSTSLALGGFVPDHCTTAAMKCVRLPVPVRRTSTTCRQPYVASSSRTPQKSPISKSRVREGRKGNARGCC
jgi:hypothetical protein